MFRVVQSYSSREFQNLQTIDLSYCKMLRQIQMAYICAKLEDFALSAVEEWLAIQCDYSW